MQATLGAGSFGMDVVSLVTDTIPLLHRALNLPGNRAIVNLSSTGIQPGAVFLISSNTVWGTDMFDETQEFKYEPSANMIAIGSRSGPVNHGGLEVARHKAIRQPHGTVAAPREVPVGDNQL
ncbi:hypothetical protein BDV93DRAFT_514675 [Ceratobasidium sp. AG-I]|nr:hypothetical protein BDV93DRAFT_514675 [Ceratobasidium sp. AG-I]